MFHEDLVKILPKIIDQYGIINIGGKTRSIFNFGKIFNKKLLKTKCKDKNIPLKQTMNLKKLREILNK